LEWLSGEDGRVWRRVVRGSTTHDSLDLMICQYRYPLVLFEWGRRRVLVGEVESKPRDLGSDRGYRVASAEYGGLKRYRGGNTDRGIDIGGW
jgi:hypothetical protein